MNEVFEAYSAADSALHAGSVTDTPRDTAAAATSPPTGEASPQRDAGPSLDGASATAHAAAVGSSRAAASQPPTVSHSDRDGGLAGHKRNGKDRGAAARRKNVQWDNVEAEEKYYEVESSDYSLPPSPSNEPPGTAVIGADGKIQWLQGRGSDSIYDGAAEYLANWAHDGALYLPKTFRQGKAQIPGLQDHISSPDSTSASPPSSISVRIPGAGLQDARSGPGQEQFEQRHGSDGPSRQQGYPSYLPQLRRAGTSPSRPAAAAAAAGDEIAISSAPQSTEVDPAAVLGRGLAVHRRDPFINSREASPDKSGKQDGVEDASARSRARDRSPTDSEGSSVRGAKGAMVTIPKLWRDGHVPRAEAIPIGSGSIRIASPPDSAGAGEGESREQPAADRAPIANGHSGGDYTRDGAPTPARELLSPGRQEVRFTPDPEDGNSSVRSRTRVGEYTSSPALPSTAPQARSVRRAGSAEQERGTSSDGEGGGGGGTGILAAASRLLRRGPSAQPVTPPSLVSVTAEVGFGGGGDGSGADEFTLSDFASHNSNRSEQLKTQVHEQNLLRQALFHRMEEGAVMRKIRDMEDTNTLDQSRDGGRHRHLSADDDATPDAGRGVNRRPVIPDHGGVGGRLMASVKSTMSRGGWSSSPRSRGAGGDGSFVNRSSPSPSSLLSMLPPRNLHKAPDQVMARSGATDEAQLLTLIGADGQTSSVSAEVGITSPSPGARASHSALGGGGRAERWGTDMAGWFFPVPSHLVLRLIAVCCD